MFHSLDYNVLVYIFTFAKTCTSQLKPPMFYFRRFSHPECHHPSHFQGHILRLVRNDIDITALYQHNNLSFLNG
jgi:hypothetical protein